MSLNLQPHQLDAIRKMKNGCILTGDVGTGKSLTALAYFYIRVGHGMPPINGMEFQPMKSPKDIYVITTAKKRDGLDWEKEATKLGINRQSDINGIQMHVDSWNNIDQYELVDNAFFIFDEQRLVGSGMWVKMFLKIAAKNDWIMLSATPGDNWMDYIPVFIAHGFYKNRTEFISHHVVFSRFAKFPKVERYTDQFVLNRYRDAILVDMPYVRKTSRHIKHLPVSYDEKLYDRVVKDRWNIYEDRPIKDISEVISLIKKIIFTDPSRIGALMRVLEDHPKLIVFYNYNYELDMLRSFAQSVDYTYSEWNGHKHQPIPTTDKWLYLVQYTAGAEGWNCTTTDTIAFWSMNYSYRIFHQAQGRIDRLNTPFIDLYYFIFRSSSSLDNGIWKALTGKKKFNESAFVKKHLESDSDAKIKS